MKNKQVLVLGAGRSSSALINYLLNQSLLNNWIVTVGDISKQMAEQRMRGFVAGHAIEFNIDDYENSCKAIAAADVVVSLLPAHLHSKAAQICLQEKKHFLTASYVTDEMKAFDAEAKSKNLRVPRKILVRLTSILLQVIDLQLLSTVGHSYLAHARTSLRRCSWNL